jgi:hypothetical protein
MYFMHLFNPFLLFESIAFQRREKERERDRDMDAVSVVSMIGRDFLSAGFFLWLNKDQNYKR